MNRQPLLPSDKLKQPRRPWLAAGIIAAFAVVGSGVGVGAYALTHDRAPATPRAQYEVPPNAAPVAVIDVSKSHLKVKVDGTGSTDADGTIVAYLWDFGDGTTAEDATASHKYKKPGEYTITLTVTDDGSRPADGTATETVKVKKKPKPPPAPAGPAAGAPGSLVPFVSSSDPNNASGGDYIDPGIYCSSGSASGNPPRCD